MRSRFFQMKLPLVCALITVVAGAPGLLRVPKVYNAVITSNQNLSPSRAFPVIQPVVHRTAVGYVPPFYYTQIAPHFAGPEVVHYPSVGGKATGSDQTQASSSSRFAESTSFGIGKERGDADRVNESSKKSDQPQENAGDAKNPPKKNQQVPLSFYPNYHSLYYEPYIYTYNSFNPHLVPDTYYVDYQPYGSLEPIPPTTPKNHAESGHLLPGFHEEKANPPRNEKEKIPDVPPPPLPTSVPKKS